MTIQQTILRACNHAKRPCEVNLGTNRRPEVIFVCSDCWNRSVYAQRDERKAQLAGHWRRYREAQAEAMKNAGAGCGRQSFLFLRVHARSRRVSRDRHDQAEPQQDRRDQV